MRIHRPVDPDVLMVALVIGAMIVVALGLAAFFIYLPGAGGSGGGSGHISSRPGGDTSLAWSIYFRDRGHSCTTQTVPMDQWAVVSGPLFCLRVKAAYPGKIRAWVRFYTPTKEEALPARPDCWNGPV